MILIHDASFIIGLAVGKKMGGGGTLDTNALEVGGGDFVDIWTIPVYEQSAEVTAAVARTRRATVISAGCPEAGRCGRRLRTAISGPIRSA